MEITVEQSTRRTLRLDSTTPELMELASALQQRGKRTKAQHAKVRWFGDLLRQALQPEPSAQVDVGQPNGG